MTGPMVNTPSGPGTPATSARPAADVRFWTASGDDALRMLDSRATSLTSGEAAARLARYGPNLAAATVRRGLAAKLIGRLSDPLIAILLIAAAISGATGDCQSFVIILVIILFSITLDIVQEYKAETAIEALKRSVAVTAALRRDGKVLELPVKDVVPGDVVELKVGDLVPADGVVLSGRDALVNEAILTGEPYPVEKRPGPSQGGSPADAFNALFGSTTIVGGETVMLVATTGRATRFGAIAASLQAKEPATAFERGIREARMDAAGAGSGERVGREEFLGKFEREVIKPIPRDARCARVLSDKQLQSRRFVERQPPLPSPSSQGDSAKAFLSALLLN